MKFECDSCHAQYMIADQKVGQRGVKVKCKKCGNVIIVRPARADGDDDTAAKANTDTQVSPPPDQAADQAAAWEADRTNATTPVAPRADEAAPTPLPTPAPPASAFDTSLFGDDDDPDRLPTVVHPRDDLATTADPRPVSPASMVAAPPPAIAADEPPDVTAEVPVHKLDLLTPTPMPMMPSVGLDLGDDLALPSFTPRVPTPPSTEPSSLPARAATPPPVALDHAFTPPPAPLPAALASPSAMPMPLDGAGVADALDDQLAGAFSHMFDGASPQLSDVVPEPPTRAVDGMAMEQLRREAADRSRADDLGLDAGMFIKPSAASPSAPSATSTNDDDAVWHAAVGDDEVGPVDLATLRGHIERGEIDRDSLVWKSGMSDWIAASDVPPVAALFQRGPMPTIAPPPEPTPAKVKRATGSASLLDLGATINDLAAPAPARSPFDMAADEVSDPTWRPHGLTDVYQAANLAEAAGAPMLPPAVANTRSSSSSSLSLGDTDWKPSASSGLSSLVDDEIARLAKGPSSTSSDGQSLDHLGAALPSLPAVSMGATLSSFDEPAPAAAFAPAFSPSFSPPAFAPPAAPARPSWMYAAGGVIATFALIAIGLTMYRVWNPPAAPVPVAVAPIVVPVAAAVPAGGVVTPVAGVPAVVPATPTTVAVVPTVPADAPPAVVAVVTPPAVDDPAAAADSVVPKGKGKDKRIKTPKEEPEEKVVVTKPKPTGDCDCDQLLDPDCKCGKSGGGAAKPAGKETLEKSDILAVIKNYVGKVKDCGKKHGGSGSIKATWKISRDGKPTDVGIADSKYAGTPLGKCVEGVIKTMRYPAYSGKAPPPVSIPLPL